MERDAAVAQGRAVFERYRSGARSSRTPATGCRTGAPATPATTRATPATALPGSGAAEGTAQSFLLRAVASTPAPTAAHNEEAAHRRELCDLLATQAALIDEASREARQLAAALDGTEAARCDSLLRLLAQQLSPLGARLVPQAKLVLAQLDSAAQRERDAARQAELAEALTPTPTLTLSLTLTLTRRGRRSWLRRPCCARTRSSSSTAGRYVRVAALSTYLVLATCSYTYLPFFIGAHA